MKARILLSVLLGVLALLIVFFWLRGPGEAPDRQAEPPRDPVEEPAARGATGEEEIVDPLLGSTEPGDESPTARQAVPPATEGPRRTWPEEETRWIDLGLILPDRTPGEERVWVLALEEDLDYAALHGAEGPLRELHAGKEPLSIEGVLGAVPVDASGVARIGLPPDVGEAWLTVGGDYLYTLESQRIDVDGTSGTVELRPVLGAWISGRLVPPPGDLGTDFTEVEVGLSWSSSAALKLGAAGSEALELRTRADSTGQFEFRAVPVGRPQTLFSRSPSLAASFGEEFDALPGEHVLLELVQLFGGSLLGRVVDEGGQPVAGADVHALGNAFFGNPSARLRSTESDTEGRFELSNVTPGKTWLRVRHDEYQEVLSAPFDLADGEVHDHGDVTLDRGLAIAGTVSFPDGAPATGTRVSVSPDLGENIAGSNVDPRDFIGRANEVTVDDSGSFDLAGLGPGPWAVSAELEVEEETEGGPAAGRWSASQSVVRAPAEGIALVLEEPLHVRGEVVDGAGTPVTAFQIRAERAGSQWYMPPSEERQQAFEDEGGRFRLTDLRSGDWTFTAMAEGYARSAESHLVLPSDQDLSFVLHRPVRLAGVVVDPGGRPAASAEVSKELELAEVIQAQQGRGDWPTARTDAQGRFELADLSPGAGSVVAKRDGFAPSEAVSYELSEGQERTDLVLTLRRGATLSGEVYGEDGDPASGCLLILQMPNLQERRITNTGSDGTFRETGLTPGFWQVQAFPGIDSLTSESGESLQQSELLGALRMTSVELADEAEEHVVLGEPPKDPVEVHGRVTLSADPVKEALISFVPIQGGGMQALKIKTLDAEGRYSLRLDEPGDYLVTIQTQGTPGRQNSIEYRRAIPAGGEYELDFAMPLGRVSGRVRGPDGGPIPRARVTLTMEGGLVFGTVFGGQYNETSTDSSGDYDISFLRPGRYRVAAGGPPLGGLVADGDLHGRRVTIVDVREDQWVRGVDFRLEEPGSLHGTVRDALGALVEGASIFLRDEEGRLVELFSVAQTNASGRFEYPGLAPGEYSITARTDDQASAGGAPVRIRSGESSEATVVVDAGTVLIVTLVDKSGSDVPSRVSVLDAQGREMNGMLALDQILERYNGGLGSAVQRVGPLPPGTYRVRAIAQDDRSAERPVTLDGRSERKVVLRLR